MSEMQDSILFVQGLIYGIVVQKLGTKKSRLIKVLRLKIIDAFGLMIQCTSNCSFKRI